MLLDTPFCHTASSIHIYHTTGSIDLDSVTYVHTHQQMHLLTFCCLCRQCIYGEFEDAIATYLCPQATWYYNSCTSVISSEVPQAARQHSWFDRATQSSQTRGKLYKQKQKPLPRNSRTSWQQVVNSVTLWFFDTYCMLMQLMQTKCCSTTLYVSSACAHQYTRPSAHSMHQPAACWCKQWLLPLLWCFLYSVIM